MSRPIAASWRAISRAASSKPQGNEMKKAERSSGIAQLAAALAVFGVCCCTDMPAGAATIDNLNVAVNDLPRSFDPGITPANVDVRAYYNVFDTLIRRDFAHPEADGGVRLVPGLAESWSWSTPTTFDLKLRHGVTCHDGSPFNADDVLTTFSQERLLGPGAFYPEGRVYFGMVRSVDKLDDFTVRFTTDYPDLALEHRLSSYISFIICDEAWNAFRKEGVSASVWMQDAANALALRPVGTGPYKVTEYLKNDRLTLTAFDDYFEGKPAAQTVTFRSVPEVAARVAGLVAGDYDIAVDLPPDQWQALNGYDDVVVKPVPLENTHVLVFNMNDPVLADKKLRHALSLSIDRKALIDALWNGKTYTPNGHQLPSYGPLYLKDRQGYVYDLARAKQLLAESSYKGQELSFRIVPNVYLYSVEAAQSMQESWRQLGINVRLDFVDSGKEQRKPGMQIITWSNTFRIPDPTGSLLVLWGPEADTQKGLKSYNANPEFNRLASVLYRSDDQAERRQAFNTMLDLFEDDMPMTMLYNPVPAYGMKNNINFTPYPHYYMDFRPANFSVEAK